MVKPYVKGAPSTDKFAIAHRRGGRCGVANSLDEIRELPEDWGYDGDRIADAIAAHNAAARPSGHLTPE
ncbi:hypothetical protein, partial [Vallitalea maricola]|uniref:hypothetical protein n=1 Tax=Vallitalea maricola TaxID=3074433 RepID=UPI0030DAF10E